MTTSKMDTLQIVGKEVAKSIGKGFDQLAKWVSSLTWWKFFLFCVLVLTSGALIQDKIINGSESQVIVTKSRVHKSNPAKTFSTENDTIDITEKGIRIRKNNVEGGASEFTIDENGLKIQTSPNTNSSSSGQTKEIFIPLSKEIASEITEEIQNAVDEAADQKVQTITRTNSDWFFNFVLLFIFALLGMKALMGGKVRAEAKASEAALAVERESLLRQVSEAQMQTMQAQVEPHFLFNTLASVEFLIETDPPRAAAMQRSLIAYLRAVLPQMRTNAPITNLGREVDMITSYLDLLKMRMEERLQVNIELPEGLRSASFPPMMLQSVVENAIKHGLECKEDGGELKFRAEVAHSKLRVTVSDTGVGFGAMPTSGTGVGLQNIRERLKLIYKEKAQLIITPNQPNGVCVTIEIPYEMAQT